MSIPITCECGHRGVVPDDMAGRQARCPQCRAVLSIPVPSPPQAEPAGRPELRSEAARDVLWAMALTLGGLSWGAALAGVALTLALAGRAGAGFTAAFAVATVAACLATGFPGEKIAERAGYVSLARICRTAYRLATAGGFLLLLLSLAAGFR